METQTRATGNAPGAASASNPTATPIGPAGTPRRPELAESTEGSAQTAASEVAEKARTWTRKGRRHLREELSRGEDFVKEHPTESAWTALGIGFALAQFPLRHIAAGFLRLTLFLLRPLALLYAAMKLIEEIRSAPPHTENRPD